MRWGWRRNYNSAISRFAARIVERIRNGRAYTVRTLTNGHLPTRAITKPHLNTGKTRTHCGGNIVSRDVARPWQNVATLLRAAQTQEMFLKIFNYILCVQDTKFVSATNVARVAKRVNIWETWSRQQRCRNNVSSFCRPLTLTSLAPFSFTDAQTFAREIAAVRLPNLRYFCMYSVASECGVVCRRRYSIGIERKVRWYCHALTVLLQGKLLNGTLMYTLILAVFQESHPVPRAPFQWDERRDYSCETTNTCTYHNWQQRFCSLLKPFNLEFKSTFSQPFKDKCISKVVRIGSIIVFVSSEKAMTNQVLHTVWWMQGRKLISERVKTFAIYLTSTET